MKLVATRKAEQNEAMIDPWTAVHFAAGLAGGLVRLPRGWSLGLAVGYEIAEQLMERRGLGQDLFQTEGPETVSNVLMDVAIFAVGHRLGELWNETEDSDP